MKPATVACVLLMLGLAACKPKAPERPNKPPTPSAAAANSVATDTDARPQLTSQIDTGGQRTQYNAYFDGTQLTQIEETVNNAVAEYHYHGARLLKYQQALPAGGTTLIELDEQGRVQRAVAGTRALAADEIDAVRTRAQLLRSHALAQQASRMHGHGV